MSTSSTPRPPAPSTPPTPPSGEADVISESAARRILLAPIPFPISVRGWLFRNCVDWRTIVRAAGLPAEAQHAVADIIRRTRLWPSEKAEVARELCAHFADAVDAGIVPADAARRFGDPKAVARLIRTSKKRGRPLWYHAWRYTFRSTAAALLLALAAYTVMAAMFFLAHPAITRNYAAELNKPILALPESQRAWPIYFEAIQKFGRIPPPIEWPSGQHLQRDAHGNPIIPTPDDPRWAAAVAWVESNGEGLALTRRAAAMPHLGFPLRTRLPEDYARWKTEHATHFELLFPPPSPSPGASDDNPPLLGLLIPYLAEFRHMAWALTIDARFAAQTHDADRFTADIRAICGIARHCNEAPTFINTLVQLAILALAQDTLTDSLRGDLLDRDQLRDLAHILSTFDDSVLSAPIAEEREFLDDFIQRSYSDNGRGDGHMTDEGLKALHGLSSEADGLLGAGSSRGRIDAVLGPLSIAAMASRKDLNAEADRLYGLYERELNTPQWLLTSSPAAEAVARLDSGAATHSRYAVLTMLFPAMGHARAAIDRARQTRDATLTALALEVYRRDHGAYPPTLDALVPRYLPAVPLDRYDGKPLKYRLLPSPSNTIPTTAVIYSIGVDRIDDGGTPPAPTPPTTTGPDRTNNVRNFKFPAAIQRLLADPKTHDDYSGDWILYRSE
jgi:hypothetical protein